MSRPLQGSGRSLPFWGGIAAVLASFAVVCLALAVQASVPATPAGGATPPDTSGPAGAADVTRPRSSSPTAPAKAHPVRLSIPAIDVRAPVTRLGLNPDRTVEVPGDPEATGWYRPGPAPGQEGSAVILGHVDSLEGPAVFARLHRLQAGDLVHVEGVGGTVSTFRVDRVATYPNRSFPAEAVYASPGQGRMLNLVTCAGEYDAEAGYQANLVVYTRMVDGG